MHATTPPRMRIDSIESSELQIVMQHTLARVDAPPRTGPGHKTPRHHVRLRQAGNRPRQTLSTRAVAQALCDQTCGPPHPRHRRGPAVVQLFCPWQCLVCNAGGMCGWRPSTRSRCLGTASGRGERRRRCLPRYTSCTLGVAGVRCDGGLRRRAARRPTIRARRERARQAAEVDGTEHGRAASLWRARPRHARVLRAASGQRRRGAAQRMTTTTPFALRYCGALLAACTRATAPASRCRAHHS